jgi:hypothetical protein
MQVSEVYASISDVVALATIVNAAQTTAKVARAGDGCDVVYGHARYLQAVDGPTNNIMKMALRVTTREGWEVFWPVSELVEQAKCGEFTPYDWSNRD